MAGFAGVAASAGRAITGIVPMAGAATNPATTKTAFSDALGGNRRPPIMAAVTRPIWMAFSRVPRLRRTVMDVYPGSI
jgi:hypothetical protein